METILSIAQEYGPLAGAVAWFLYRDWKREDRLSARIDQLEDETRKVLMPLVKQTAEVITRNTEALSKLQPLLEHHRK